MVETKSHPLQKERKNKVEKNTNSILKLTVLQIIHHWWFYHEITIFHIHMPFFFLSLYCICCLNVEVCIYAHFLEHISHLHLHTTPNFRHFSFRTRLSFICCLWTQNETENNKNSIMEKKKLIHRLNFKFYFHLNFLHL